FGFPISVSCVGEGAFSFCTNLTSVVIPNSVTSIGDEAFSGCRYLESVSSYAPIPPTLGKDVFNGVDKATLNVPEQDLSAYQTAEGWKDFANIIPIPTMIDRLRYKYFMEDNTAVVTYSERNSLDNYKGLQEVVIPDGINFQGVEYAVTAIGSEAFNYCWGLKSVALPATLKSIDNLAFGYCTSLREIVIPDEVTAIGNEAFTGCSALAEVKLGRSVESIGDYAFFGCTGIGELYVPESVKTIGDKAFMGVNWINEIHAEAYIPAEVPETAFSASAYRTATLFVPKGSLASYKSHPTWSKFINIEEDDNDLTGIDEVATAAVLSVKVVGGAVEIEDAKDVRIFTAEGSEVYSGGAGRVELAPGIYITVIDNSTSKIVIR
ncbi:MAG: leucine-rich repeat domain-containing protein, partial [Muribaculaceae bacterium]|nr:leucine-rich repeat domain-containing protein [Muribaculaceae bacterium]